MARKHNEEFKREAVRIALTSGLTRRQVASDLGIGFSTLAKWVQKSKPDDLPPHQTLILPKRTNGFARRTVCSWRRGISKKRQRCSSRTKANEICLC